MTYYEPRTFFDPEGLNSTGRAFYECTQGYQDLMSPGMNILQDPNQPWLLDKLTRDDLVCPLEHTCTPAGDAAGMYVRDTADGKVYFSEFGWQRYDEGADIDWVGVVKDLLIIVGGSIGGTGGLFSAVSQMLGVAGWGISLFHDNPPPR